MFKVNNKDTRTTPLASDQTKIMWRPNLDYVEMIYEKPPQGSIMQKNRTGAIQKNHLKAPLYRKIERVQYNTCLLITGAFKGTSRERLYQGLG